MAESSAECKELISNPINYDFTSSPAEEIDGAASNSKATHEGSFQIKPMVHRRTRNGSPRRKSLKRR